MPSSARNSNHRGKSTLLLQGAGVLDFGSLLLGRLVSLSLAEVIKFERLNRGDEVRNYPQQGEANSQFGFDGGCALAIQ